jgi:hypothetical protein
VRTNKDHEAEKMTGRSKQEIRERVGKRIQESDINERYSTLLPQLVLLEDHELQ